MSDTSYQDFLKACRAQPPRLAFVLGSGLGDVGDYFEVEHAVPFAQAPGLVETTVTGHRGALLLGSWAGQRVLIFSGRLHYYEGHPWRSVEQPVALAHELGARTLVLTNAAGGIRDDLGPGTLMALSDCLDWTHRYPWRHPGPGSLSGPRPSPFCPDLLSLLERAAKSLRLPLATGIYAQVTGPCYETRAEIRALRSLGADAVGMSTGREAERGRALGMRCAALSCICNRAAGLSDAPIRHEEVLTAGRLARDKLVRLLEAFLRLSGDSAGALV